MATGSLTSSLPPWEEELKGIPWTDELKPQKGVVLTQREVEAQEKRERSHLSDWLLGKE